MKKLTAMGLILAFLFTMSACTEKANDGADISGNSDALVASDGTNTSNTTDDSDSVDVEHTGKKIEGNITKASAFSEGLAFVFLNGNEEKLYCINKEGYIVFELDTNQIKDSNTGMAISPWNIKFVNGLALIGGAMYDKNGKATLPEDVGATGFYSIALEGGYVVAEKITATYNSTKKEMGVLNTNFEWVVEPSEEIYESAGFSLDFSTIYYSETYYSNGYIFFSDSKCYLNCSNGSVSKTADIDLPSEKWHIFTDHTYRDYEENVILDMSGYENVTLAFGSDFVNGKAPVTFRNKSANKDFVTIINEKGEFLFEPVEVTPFPTLGYMNFDGEILVVEDSRPDNYSAYNTKGELLGTLCLDDIEKNKSYTCKIGDGVITVCAGYNFKYDCYFFNPDFTPLF